MSSNFKYYVGYVYEDVFELECTVKSLAMTHRRKNSHGIEIIFLFRNAKRLQIGQYKTLIP